MEATPLPVDWPRPETHGVGSLLTTSCCLTGWPPLDCQWARHRATRDLFFDKYPVKPKPRCRCKDTLEQTYTFSNSTLPVCAFLNSTILVAFNPLKQMWRLHAPATTAEAIFAMLEKTRKQLLLWRPAAPCAKPMQSYVLSFWGFAKYLRKNAHFFFRRFVGVFRRFKFRKKNDLNVKSLKKDVLNHFFRDR